MPWSAVISSDDVVAIHAALVPTVNGDGEILLFGGDDHDRAANIAGQWDHSRRFNCRHPTQALIYVQSPTPGRDNNRPERYQPLTDRWVMLAPTGADVSAPDLFPRLHVLRDGSVFVSSMLLGNTRCIAIDPWTGNRQEVVDLPDAAYQG